MKTTPGAGLLVALAIAAVIGAAVWAAMRGQGKAWEVAAEIDRGVMSEYCRLLRADSSRSLFSRTREFHLLYELSYPGRTVPEYARVNDADGSWRLEGTYHLTAGETYDFLLW